MQNLKKNWQTQHDRISGEMQQMLLRIDKLQEQISHEANLNKRDLQLKELDETTQQFDEYIGNSSEMGQQLQLITDFVHHIRKRLLSVEGKINEMKEQLNSMGNGIKFLKGKSVEQLLEIQKWKVLKEAAYKYVKSIYVPLKSQESGKKEQSNLMNLDQFKDKVGEEKQLCQYMEQLDLAKVQQQRKLKNFYGSCMRLIKKSTIKTHTYLYFTTIFKNLVFQAVEETLRSDDYGFDTLQLKECKEKFEKKEQRFLLIMDSYDETKLGNIQKNLYLNNKVRQNWSGSLGIFTTRAKLLHPEKKRNLKKLSFLNLIRDKHMNIYKNKLFKVLNCLLLKYTNGNNKLKKKELWILIRLNCLGNNYRNHFRNFFDRSKQKTQELLNSRQIESLL
ncbi:unnamed protein product [Paramecium sonneborni]|uniref:Uncharacterized protein n=1 Tax=Paramecium sonneborni TaxID=65129 RepID=A0A8S1P6U0_9CILI|nr:unnamed protein product [Paramecium sonneborni]